MKLQAVLSKTTTDRIKSKLQSTELAELVLDIYCTPEQYAEIIKKYFDKGFIIEIHEEN